MGTTLEEFKRNNPAHADRQPINNATGSPREGWARYPDKFESETILHECLAAGMQASAAETDAFDAYIRGEYELNEIGEWIDAQKTKRPHLFPDSGQYALEATAFGENGRANLSDRNRLVNLIGLENANVRAKAWGLESVSDFKTKTGRRPDMLTSGLHEEISKLESNIARDTAKLAKARAVLPDTDKLSNASNPFTKLKGLDGVVNPEVAAKVAGMIRALGSKKVSEIAAAVGRTLSGDPIPGKFR